MNAEKKWTPEPWRIAGKGTIRASEGWVADVHWRNREANAALIFAAPDMAEALTPLADLAAAYFRDGRRDDVPDSTAVWGFNDVTLTAGDLRKAVAALRKAGAL